MNHLRKNLILPLLFFGFGLVSGQELECKLTGRMLMDGGLYLQNPAGMGHGLEFNDLRVGAKAAYGPWRMKIELGYAGNKAAVKDAFLAYDRGRHSVQVGQFYEPFSPEMLCSTFDLRFHQSPGAVLALTNSRRMGMAYTYSAKHLFFSGGLFTDSDLSNVKNAAQGYALDARVVYRPLNEAGKLLHLGIAAIRRTPDGTTEADEVRDVFAFQSPGISTIDKRTLYQAQADHALFQWKTGVELLFSYHRFFLQSEYLRARVHRRDAFADYTAEGFYAQCSWLLRGHTYLYDEAMACPSRPDGRSLELCVRFNHLDLNDSPAGIWGGSEQDVSLGLNYYHNKHVGFKVSYGYLMPGTHSPVVSSAFGVLQARAQFIF